MKPLQYAGVLGSSMVASYIFASLTPRDTSNTSSHPNSVNTNTTNLSPENLVEFYESRRKWKPILPSSTSSSNSTKSSSFTFMSYNILADGRYINSHKKDCPEEYLQWDYRWNLIESQLMAYKPDIIAIQEVTEDMFKKSTMQEDMLNKFNMKGLHAPKDRIKGNVQQSDALFYDINKFELINNKTVYLRELAQSIENRYYFNGGKPKIFNDITGNNKAYNTMFWKKLKSRYDCVIIGLFKTKNNDNNDNNDNNGNKEKYFVVCASHLFYHPTYGDIKTAQTYLMNNAIYMEVEKMLKDLDLDIKVDDIPIVMGIDANAMPASGRDNNGTTGPTPFDPYMGDKSMLERIENIEGIRKEHMTPVLDAKDGYQGGVYELFTTGRLFTSHPEHAIGRFNIRSMFSEFDSNKSKEEKEYNEMMGTWKWWDFDKYKEYQGLKGFNYNWETPLKFKSVYKQLNNNNKEPNYTTKVSWFEGCIDYIWITNGFEVDSILDWENNGNLPTDITYPSQFDPSDHLPLGAKLRLP